MDLVNIAILSYESNPKDFAWHHVCHLIFDVVWSEARLDISSQALASRRSILTPEGVVGVFEEVLVFP